MLGKQTTTEQCALPSLLFSWVARKRETTQQQETAQERQGMELNGNTKNLSLSHKVRDRMKIWGHDPDLQVMFVFRGKGIAHQPSGEGELGMDWTFIL